jgi:hypothetical protein
MFIFFILSILVMLPKKKQYLFWGIAILFPRTPTPEDRYMQESYKISVKNLWTMGQKYSIHQAHLVAGWSSPVARQAHNLKVVGSNPTPATNSRATLMSCPLNLKNPIAAN